MEDNEKTPEQKAKEHSTWLNFMLSTGRITYDEVVERNLDRLPQDEAAERAIMWHVNRRNNFFEDFLNKKEQEKIAKEQAGEVYKELQKLFQQNR